MRSPHGSVLLADDEEGILKTLGRALRDEGHDVTATASASEAQRLLQERSFDVFVVDHRMPGRTGLELIRDLAAAVPEGERPQVLMMTAHATVENAIEAMKLGAYDYLQKPFEVDELLVAVRRALEHQSLSRQHRYLLSEREEDFDHYGIVGKSRAIEELLRKIELVARSKSTVLVTGETGTGKELAARAIHAHSAQRDMPLIKVNCAAIPEALLESELFGHVKGAFTGATANRRGRFALADGGTIFLDEIGTLALPVHAVGAAAAGGRGDGEPVLVDRHVVRPAQQTPGCPDRSAHRATNAPHDGLPGAADGDTPGTGTHRPGSATPAATPGRSSGSCDPNRNCSPGTAEFINATNAASHAIRCAVAPVHPRTVLDPAHRPGSSVPSCAARSAAWRRRAAPAGAGHPRNCPPAGGQRPSCAIAINASGSDPAAPSAAVACSRAATRTAPSSAGNRAVNTSMPSSSKNHLARRRSC